MKDLKTIICESLLDDEEEIGKNVEINIKTKIKQFLKDNYKGRCKISKTPDSDGKYIVDCEGDLICRNKVHDSITNDFFKFGVIKGDFIFKGTSKITSLEGGPIEVGNRCWYHNVNVETLEGAPKIVKYFECISENLISLNGCPEHLIGFSISSPKLASLKNSPRTVEVYICQDCIKLKNFEGMPNTVTDLYCQHCLGLESFEGCPNELNILAMDDCYQFSKKDITKVHFPKRIKSIYNGNCGWIGEDIIKVCDFDTCTHAKNRAMLYSGWKK